MQTSRVVAGLGVLALFLVLSYASACKCGGSSDGEQTPPAKQDVGQAGSSGPAAGETAAATQAGGSGTAAGTAAASGGSDTGAGTAAGSGGTAGSGDTGGLAQETEGTGAAQGGETEGDTEGGVATAQLQEIESLRTTDARAQAAITEAEAAGATVEVIALAINKRGQLLHRRALQIEDEARRTALLTRAKTFFELALEKDEKLAIPAFNLAKIAVMDGEVDETKKWLTIVREREGGRKLIRSIEFDPMWAIVNEEPEVRALLK